VGERETLPERNGFQLDEPLGDCARTRDRRHRGCWAPRGHGASWPRMALENGRATGARRETTCTSRSAALLAVADQYHGRAEETPRRARSSMSCPRRTQSTPETFEVALGIQVRQRANPCSLGARTRNSRTALLM